MAFQWSIPGTMLRPRTVPVTLGVGGVFFFTTLGVSLASVAVVFFRKWNSKNHLNLKEVDQQKEPVAMLKKKPLL